MNSRTTKIDTYCSTDLLKKKQLITSGLSNKFPYFNYFLMILIFTLHIGPPSLDHGFRTTVSTLIFPSEFKTFINKAER